MNYEEMSDFEINKAVSNAYLPCEYIFNEAQMVVELANYQDVMVDGMHNNILAAYALFNPCNNPSDAWPIIVENKISLVKDEDRDYWESFSEYMCPDYHEPHFEKYAKDQNPLRAAMIVYLEMQESGR